MPRRPSMPTARHISKTQMLSRIGASLVGGWAFVWGFVVLATLLLVRAGLTYADAQTLAQLLAFLVFLVAFCASYAAASVARVWAVLLVGGLAMTTLAWWLMRAIA